MFNYRDGPQVLWGHLGDRGAGGTLPGEMTPQVGVQEPAAVVQVRRRKISHQEDLREQTSENELENSSHILHRQLQTAPHS